MKNKIILKFQDFQRKYFYKFVLDLYLVRNFLYCLIEFL